MSSAGLRVPLDPATFPPNLQMHVGPQAPPPMKMMAARGMVAAPPQWSLRLVYQLSFDAEVGQAATEHLGQLPVNILLPSLTEEQPGGVLDWVMEHRKEPQVQEALVRNQGIEDASVVALAKIASTGLSEVIAANQVRILRAPQILENLYLNPNARMATIDKLVELAHRNGVDLEGLPEVQAALDAGIDLGLEDASTADFDAFLEEDKVRAEEEEKKGDGEEEMTAAQKRAQRIKEAKAKRMSALKRTEEEEEEDDEAKSPLYVRVQRMKLSQKIRLAKVGSREAVNLLVKDSNRLVHEAAIKSSRLKYSDILRIAGQASMADSVIREIAKNREWTQHYDVMRSLVNNPKTPLASAVKFLTHLRTNDLRDLQRSRNISPQLRRQAKNLLEKRR